MRRTNLKAATRSLRRSVKKHSPAILTALGIGGFITTTVMAVKVTPKAMEDIENKKKTEGKEKLTRKETIQVVWKHYAIPAALGVTSATCVICANSIHSKRNAALAAACTISERALVDYKDSAKEIVGEKKEEKISDNVIQKKKAEHPIGNKELVAFDGDDTIFFEPMSGRYFKGSINGLDRIINQLSSDMRYGDPLSLNDFYEEVGLSYTEIGETHGWNFMTDGCLDISYIPEVEKDTSSKYCGKVIVSLKYNTPPHFNFNSMYD